MADDKTKDDATQETLAAGIESAVDNVMNEHAERNQTEDEAQNEPAADVEDDAGTEDTNTPDPSDDGDAIPDAMLERAVRAGLTMMDARKFGDAALLESVVSRLEAASSSNEVSEDADEESAGEANDPLSVIPDLDPDEYDEKIVSGFKAMKDLIRSQHETIQSLQGAGSVDWFDGQVQGLDKAVLKTVESDATKREALRQKFDVLSAGYKAAGQDVSRDAIFREAVSIALGDVLTNVAVNKTTTTLNKRSGQHISPPKGHREKVTGDPIADTVAVLDQRYGT